MLALQTGGSQMWDAALAVQAILASGLTQEYTLTLKKAHAFIKASQVCANSFYFGTFSLLCVLSLTEKLTRILISLI